MKKKMIAATAIFAILGSGLFAAKLVAGDGNYCDRGGHMSHAGWGGHRGGQRGGEFGEFAERRVERMADYLELSEAQRDRVFAILDEARPQMRESMRDLRQLRGELIGLDTSVPNYRERSEALAARAGEALQAMMLGGADLKARVLAELTEEQRAQALEMMARRGKGKHRQM